MDMLVQLSRFNRYFEFQGQESVDPICLNIIFQQFMIILCFFQVQTFCRSVPLFGFMLPKNLYKLNPLLYLIIFTHIFKHLNEDFSSIIITITIIMGNCCEEYTHGLEQNRLSIHKQPNNILKSTIQAQLQSFPILQAVVAQNIEKLGEFPLVGLNTLPKIYRLKNEVVYWGQIKNDLYEGPGKMLFPDGTLMESYFLHGSPQNRTRIFKGNGDYFDGDIGQNGVIWKGVVSEKGVKYEGELRNKKPHGYGVQSTKNYEFRGTFCEGKKINGILEWKKSKQDHKYSYSGGFEDNLFSGKGILESNEGKYDGNFEHGLKNGYGQFVYSDGTIYKGAFNRNKPDGEGKLLDSSGKILFEGLWINGKRLNVRQ